MRLMLLLALIVLAAGGVWVLLLADRQVPESQDWGDAGAAGAGEPPAGASMSEIADAPLVAVWGTDGGAPLPRVDYGGVFERPLRFDAQAKGLTGAGWLAAVEKQVGKRLPIRFTSEAGLERFRGLRLLDEPPPAEIDVPATLEWLRAAGFVAEEKDSFLLLHAKRSP